MKHLGCLILGVFLFVSFCSTEKHKLKTRTENEYTYQYVTNDPKKTRIYTLDNGLKVYLSQDKASPVYKFRSLLKLEGKMIPKTIPD